MCEQGVNTRQLGLMIAQVEDYLGVSQQSLEQIHHLADGAGLREPSALVAQATVLLGETRAKLELAIDKLESSSQSDDVTVERV